MFRRKTTFAFIAAAFFAAQVFAANPWLAEKNGQSILKAELPPCTADGPAQNRSFTVRNCTTKISCATTGTETVRMVCDGTTWRAINATATAVDLGDYVLIDSPASVTMTSVGSFSVEPTTSFTVDVTGGMPGRISLLSKDYINLASDSGPVNVTSTTSVNFTTPILGISGAYERAVTNVTVADDAAGTKPTGAIPITTDFATCTCNDATGCTMSIAEPTPTAGYGRSLTIVSIGTGNCEFAESSGVTEIGAALVLEPTSTATYVYANAAWHLTATADNVP